MRDCIIHVGKTEVADRHICFVQAPTVRLNKMAETEVI